MNLTKTLNNSEGQGSQPFRSAYSTPNYFTTTLNLSKELEMNQEENLGTIYVVTNLVNGKQNVGQTTRSLKRRISEHKRGDKPTSLLYKAIKKYGFENFKVISFSCLEEDLDWTETFLIAELKTQAPNGYNLQPGGNKYKHAHESTKQKMSENHYDCSGENNPMFGTHPSEEMLKQMSERQLGKPSPFKGQHHTEETLKKIRNNLPDMSGENGSFFGHHHTEESLKKMRVPRPSIQGENHYLFGKHRTEESRKKQSENHADVSGENHPQARAVILISPEGIEYQLPCYYPFCREHQLDPSHISKVFNGKLKQHHGWTGRYLNEETK